MPRPNLIVLAGPNGAGKTTAAPALLVGALHVEEFVNADIIARGLSAFRPEEVAFTAGKLMLERLRQLTEQRADVAFESTLASRTFAPWIRTLTAGGYVFRICFLWLPSADMAVDRVRDRVLAGGHDVPEFVIRRRYEGGLKNFFRLCCLWLRAGYSSIIQFEATRGWSLLVPSITPPRFWTINCGTM